MQKIFTPLNNKAVEQLKSGQQILLNGKLYTGRDAAHKKLMELIEKGEMLPFNLLGQVLYYVGPAPAKPGQVIGSAGPTTSKGNNW
jgi:fumarate hydratase subunit beta